MTEMEAMRARHSVRSYQDRPLPADVVEALEAEIAEIESTLADPSIYAKDNARAVALTARLPVARAELDAAETRWLELSERA